MGETTEENRFKHYVLNWRPSPLQEKLGSPLLTLQRDFDSTTLPRVKDLSCYDSPIRDQGKLGSCTSFAAVALIEHIAKRFQKTSDWSELYVYYNTRVKVLHWDPNEDTGAYVSSTMKALSQYGDSGETDWPYDTTKFSCEPPTTAYTRGAINQVTKTAFLPVSVDAFRTAINAGNPVDIGFVCYSNLYDANKTGKVPMPKEGSYIIGGHSVTIVGYDDNSREFKFKNSWGADWGDKGYGYLPYDYVSGYTIDDSHSRLVDDAWTILQIEYDSDFVQLPPEKVGVPTLQLVAVTA